MISAAAIARRWRLIDGAERNLKAEALRLCKTFTLNIAIETAAGRKEWIVAYILESKSPQLGARAKTDADEADREASHPNSIGGDFVALSVEGQTRPFPATLIALVVAISPHAALGFSIASVEQNMNKVKIFSAIGLSCKLALWEKSALPTQPIATRLFAIDRRFVPRQRAVALEYLRSGSLL